MATKTVDYKVISTDGHALESPDMWEKYLPKKFHDIMPKLVKDPKGGDAWELVPGAPPMPARGSVNRTSGSTIPSTAGRFGGAYDQCN